MKMSKKNIGKYFTYFILCFVFSGVSGLVFAQEAIGISVGYEFILYTKFADSDPIIPGMEDVKLQLNTIHIGAAFP